MKDNKIFTIWDFLNPKEEESKSTYGYKETREYILKKAKQDNLENQLYLNISFNKVLPASFESWFKTKSLEEEYEEFKKVYNSFCWHLFSEKLKILSYRCNDDYHLIYIPSDDPFIVETTPVKNLFKDYTCAPACEIKWYNKDGTFTNDFMRYREGEELTNEITKPVASKNMSFAEYYRDRREYYFFNVLQVHKFGKNDRVSERPLYDTFTNYRWRLEDIVEYYREEVEE